MIKKIALLLFIVSFLSTLFLACGEGGTETGNPTDGDEFSDGEDAGDDADDQPTSAPIDDADSTEAESIGSALCTVLSQCFSPLASDDCEAGLLAVSNIDTELGLAVGEFADFALVITAEQEGSLIADETTAAQCVADIEALACADASVQAAYDEDNADSFDNVFRMIPLGDDSCAGVY